MNRRSTPQSPQLQGSISLHFGTVIEVDYQSATAKVQINDLQQFQTFQLPVLQNRASANSNSYWMPNPAENVALLLDANGEQGVILGGVYNRAAPSSVNSADQLDVKTALTTIASDVEITGNVTITGNVQTIGDTNTQGAVTVQGSHAINGKDTVVVGSTDSGGDINNESGQ